MARSVFDCNGIETENEASMIGILGGSFDPVHNGHLILALDALEQVGLEQVVFMPAARSPLKAQDTAATAEQRVAMLQLALHPYPAFTVDCWEIEREQISYSYHTACYLRDRYPGRKLFWMIGADQLQLLPKWYKIKELASMVSFIVALRPDYSGIKPSGLDAVRTHLLRSRPLSISSTEIRLRAGSGRMIRPFIPVEVHSFIHQNNIYQSNPNIQYDR